VLGEVAIFTTSFRVMILKISSYTPVGEQQQ
jgi:hypothetical protein